MIIWDRKQSFYEYLDDCEKQILADAVILKRGNISEIAKKLQIDRKNCYKKLKKHNLMDLVEKCRKDD